MVSVIIFITKSLRNGALVLSGVTQVDLGLNSTGFRKKWCYGLQIAVCLSAVLYVWHHSVDGLILGITYASLTKHLFVCLYCRTNYLIYHFKLPIAPYPTTLGSQVWH